MPSCSATGHIVMQLGRRNRKAGSLSKTLGQGDTLSPVPEQEEAAGSSKESQPPRMDGVDLGWLLNVHQAALLLPLNSSPSAGATLCKSQTNKSWLGKMRGLLKELKTHKVISETTILKHQLGQGKGNGAELSSPTRSKRRATRSVGTFRPIVPRGSGDSRRRRVSPGHWHSAPTMAGLCRTHAWWALL